MIWHRLASEFANVALVLAAVLFGGCGGRVASWQVRVDPNCATDQVASVDAEVRAIMAAGPPAFGRTFTLSCSDGGATLTEIDPVSGEPL